MSFEHKPFNENGKIQISKFTFNWKEFYLWNKLIDTKNEVQHKQERKPGMNIQCKNSYTFGAKNHSHMKSRSTGKTCLMEKLHLTFNLGPLSTDAIIYIW